jgi:hypothetical protein
MMPPECPHCRKPFRPEVHNAWHQHFCTRKACQRARNRQSCRTWRQKNPDYFRNDTPRTRVWREEHPYYWRNERRKACTVDIMLPVHLGARRRVGLRFRDSDGITLQHVVLAMNRGWLAVWRDVGLTLQNVVPRWGRGRLSWAA